jgi:hypothetical protein
MNFKTKITLIGCLLAANLLCGQINFQKDSIERCGLSLYDGSFILGQLVEDERFVITIIAASNDTMTIEKDLVMRFRKESDGIRYTTRGRYHLDRGVFVNFVPFGLGVSANGNGSYTSQIVVGYHIDERFALGVGTGFEFHGDQISFNWYTFSGTPVFVYGKYNLLRRGTRIYGYGKVGYFDIFSFNQWNDIIRANVYADLGFGISFPSSWGGKFSFEIGRTLVGLNGDLNNRDWVTGNQVRQDFRKLLNRGVFKFGMTFGK